LIARSINNNIAAGCSPIFTVLGANQELIHAEITDLSTSVVINDDWASGMGSSISSGINALVQSGTPARAVLITLCDQPLITADHLHSLVQVFNERAALVVASEYEMKGRTVRGVPAVFSAQLFRELGELAGAEGAKSVIVQNEARACFVEIPAAAIDLDTPEDYEMLRGLESD
jgi:molybdenum cofactor cytidylyltransferase